MIGISGMGVYIPPNKVSVDVLGTFMLPTNKQNGHKSHVLETDLTATQMAIEASIKALDDSGVAPLDIDLIINTSHPYMIIYYGRCRRRFRTAYRHITPNFSIYIKGAADLSWG